MAIRSRTRRAARRSALLALGAARAATGGTRKRQPSAGVSILLLHNTPVRVLPAIERVVVRHRDSIAGYNSSVEMLQMSTQPPPSGLAFSFDDGFRSNLLVARMLAEYGVSACFFVPTGVIGESQAGVDRFFRRPQSEGVMGWRDLESLVAMGHVVGSHSVEHRPLIGMTSDQAEAQVKESVELLRSNLGSCQHYAWPYGALSFAPAADVVRWCTEVGVTAASGVRGRNHPDLLRSDGYLRRDAADPRWISNDVNVFTSRPARPALA